MFAGRLQVTGDSQFLINDQLRKGVVMGEMLLLLGAVMSLVGWIWIIVTAFGEGELVWGIGSIIIPLVAIVYGIVNFDETKIPLGLLVFGIALRFVGIFEIV